MTDLLKDLWLMVQCLICLALLAAPFAQHLDDRDD